MASSRPHRSIALNQYAFFQDGEIGRPSPWLTSRGLRVIQARQTIIVNPAELSLERNPVRAESCFHVALEFVVVFAVSAIPLEVLG
jgi:hypothetical protein